MSQHSTRCPAALRLANPGERSDAMKASPPARHERVTVDERNFGQLLHGGGVVIGVALDEDDPEVVVPAEVGDALVDVFGMEEVVADPGKRG